MNQQDWRTAIEQLAPQIHLRDAELLRLLRNCVPEQGISSMAEAQAILLRNFPVGGSKPDACAQWLTEVTRALCKPIPFREVFVILALFLPQLTFAEGAKLEGRLWYSPIVSSEVSMVSVTPVAQGLQGMHEYKIAFASHSRAAAFVSPDQPVQSFESLAMLPSEQIHIGSQVGRVYRLVLWEDSQVFALLMVLLEYATQPKKRSRQGSQESKEELAVRQSSPKSWTVAFISTPETFAPLPVTADTPRYCPQATGFSRQLCSAAGTDSAHILSIALSMVSALQSGRSSLAIAGVFGAGKTRSLTFLLAWFAITTNLRFGVAHKEGSGHEVIARSLKQTQEEKLRDVFLLIPVKKRASRENFERCYSRCYLGCICKRFLRTIVYRKAATLNGLINARSSLYINRRGVSHQVVGEEGQKLSLFTNFGMQGC